MIAATAKEIPAIGEAPVVVESPAPPMSNPVVLRGETIRGGDHAIVDDNHAVAFEIASIIGEGGMGIVYKAVQDYPCRAVALKALKGSLVESALLKRFENEVSILALLRHPGICQLYSAGTLQDGSGVRVPFLAMELVYGSPIHQHCRKNRLTLRQKLELFLKVAEAIQYVHTTGILHRDLTCRNILVNEHGEPKVLDFGLATFADRRSRELSLATESGHPFGTLQYASPEQAAGQTHLIDRRTDVYALGVVLYKLLTGRHPLNVGGLSTPEIVRRIQEEEPARLSSRNKKLRGDLETIVHKAMSKAKADRYGSVAELAADLRNYLADEPIRARAPGRIYVATKFVRRHRVLVTTAMLIILSLAAGMAAALHEASRAHGEAARANAEASRANLESRRATIRLAEAKVAQGDALLLAERFNEARDSYNIAWQEFDRAGESSITAQLGIWELDQLSARPIRQVLPQDNGVSRVAISPNRRWLAICVNGIVQVRDVISNQVETQFDLKNAASELEFSPNGKFVAGLANGHCVVWNVEAHKLVYSSESSAPAIADIALSDGAVAIVTSKGNVSVREFNGMETAIQFPEKHGRIRNVAFAKDGGLYVIDANWHIWKCIATGNVFSMLGTIPHAASDNSPDHFFAISPAGGFVAKFGPEGAAIYALPDLKEMVHLPVRATSRGGGFSDESTLYIGDAAQDRYEIYGIDGQLRLVLPESASGLPALAGGMAVVTITNRPLVLWSTASSPGIRKITISVIPSAGELSRDGRIAVLGSEDGLIRIYDAIAGHLLATLDAGEPIKMLKLDDSLRTLISVTQNDKASSMTSLIQFWSLATLTKTAQFKQSGPVKAFALARSGTMAMSCVFGQKTIRLWRNTKGNWNSKEIDVEFPATGIDMSSDEESALITGNPLGIELWRMLPQPERLRTLMSSGACINAVFGGNGRFILAKDARSRSFHVWEAPTDQPASAFICTKIPGLAATSMNNTVVISDGGNLIMLDVQTGRVLRRFPIPSLASRTLSMSDDGQQVLVTGDGPGAMVLDFSVPLTLHSEIDGLSRADQARWLAACGVSPEPQP